MNKWMRMFYLDPRWGYAYGLERRGHDFGKKN